MKSYSKPFVDVHSQLEILKRRGMAIGDERYAVHCLKRIGYYRLSAYWHPFLEIPPTSHKASEATLKVPDRFRPGTTFENSIRFYQYDKSVRMLITEALELVEIGVRAALIEVLGAHGPFAHRDSRSFDNGWGLKHWLKKQDSNFRRSHEDFAKHFRNKYSGHPPLWIAAGAWDWGCLAHCIEGLSFKNCATLCKKINGDLENRQLTSWMRTLNEVRNVCAHHSRLWNWNIKNIPASPGALTEYSPAMKPARLYSVIVILDILERSLQPNSDWLLRLMKLIKTVDLPQEVSARSAGFPGNSRQALLWQA